MTASASFSAEEEQTSQDQLSDIFSNIDAETRVGEDSFHAHFNNRGKLDDHNHSLVLPWASFRIYLGLTHRES